MLRNRWIGWLALPGGLALAACSDGGEPAAAIGGSAGTATAGAPARGGSATGGSSGSAPLGGSSGGALAASGMGGGGTASGVTGAAGSGSGGHSGSGGGVSGGGTGGSSGGAAGAGSKCGAGLYLCEDFEGATVGGSTVPGWTTQGSVQVASDQAHSGSKALKIGAKLTGERTIRRSMTQDGKAIPGTQWGRVFYRIDTPFPVPSDFVHSVHVFGDGNVSAGKVQVRVFDTIMQSTSLHKFGYNVQRSYGNNSEHGVFTNPEYKYESTWKCAEWHLDATEQSFHFYVNGSEIKAIAIANAKAYYTGDPEIPTTFSSMSVGWNNFQTSTSPGFVAWFDDFALGPSRVGCE